MDLALQTRIASKLDAIRAAGWLSEYLVAWHGSGGTLAPSVTIWPAPNIPKATALAQIRAALAGLVSVTRIVVAGI
jgi:hypothetical protein